LLERVDQGLFREDLYYRIVGIDVTLPTLRERRSDIQALAEALLARCGGTGKNVPKLAADAMARLIGYDYPGNVRELRNVLQKAVALSGNGTIHARHIQFDSLNEEKVQTAARTGISAGNPVSPTVAGTPSAISIEEMEIRHICELLEHHGGHRRTVADILGISERTLYRKLNRYGLHPVNNK